MEKFNQELPQYLPEKRSGVSLEKSDGFFCNLVEKEFKKQPDYRIHLRYQHLLLKALPEVWHHRVYFHHIQSGLWHLVVSNSADAYKLNFLLPEFETHLNKHLKNPAKLKVHVEPKLWQIVLQSRQSIKVKSARAFSEAEIEEIFAKI